MSKTNPRRPSPPATPAASDDDILSWLSEPEPPRHSPPLTTGLTNRDENANAVMEETVRAIDDGQQASISWFDRDAVFQDEVRYYEAWITIAGNNYPKLTVIAMKSRQHSGEHQNIIAWVGPYEQHANQQDCFPTEEQFRKLLPAEVLSNHGKGRCVSNYALPGCSLTSTATFDKIVNDIGSGKYVVLKILAVKGKPPSETQLEGKPSELSPAEGYYECDRPSGDARCSDNSCPCSDTIILRGTGYLYISQENVDLRRQHPVLEDARRAMKEKLAFLSGGLMVRGTYHLGPIVCCEQAARLRNLDLAVAAADAKYWWETGLVPLRPTPLNSKPQQPQAVRGKQPPTVKPEAPPSKGAKDAFDVFSQLLAGGSVVTPYGTFNEMDAHALTISELTGTDTPDAARLRNYLVSIPGCVRLMYYLKSLVDPSGDS